LCLVGIQAFCICGYGLTAEHSNLTYFDLNASKQSISLLASHHRCSGYFFRRQGVAGLRIEMDVTMSFSVGAEDWDGRHISSNCLMTARN
ncbi:hypothetical protein, partial [Xanthomonas translucens]|uniref:hypothetical protein n=1 Tax=Xanthomonas campestris pv. translucens TaxID=343 RepID=UPI001BAEF4AE